MFDEVLAKDLKFNAQMPIELQGFYGWYFAFLDPVHEVPRSFVFQCDFLNFIVEKRSFCFLDETFEIFTIHY